MIGYVENSGIPIKVVAEENVQGGNQRSHDFAPVCIEKSESTRPYRFMHKCE